MKFGMGDYIWRDSSDSLRFLGLVVRGCEMVREMVIISPSVQMRICRWLLLVAILQIQVAFLDVLGSAQAWGGTPSPPSSRTRIPALILFGDSTVDVGNNNFLNTFARSDFPPYGRAFDTKTATGRFTDGRMVGDFVAISLGLPLPLAYLDPNATRERIVQGINFASAASGYLSTTSMLLNVIPAFRQLAMFQDYKTKLAAVVGQQRASSIVSDALYFVSTGSNDYILNYYLSPSLQQRYTTVQFSKLLLSMQTQFLQQLYEGGARRIIVFGFPPIGCLPAQITVFGKAGQEGCLEDMNEVANAYNMDLQSAIPRIQTSLPDVNLLYVDVFSFLYEAFNNPAKYGYTETRRACCGEGYFATAYFCNSNSRGTCSDASKFMFFDSLHPSQSVYQHVANVTYMKAASYFRL